MMLKSIALTLLTVLSASTPAADAIRLPEPPPSASLTPSELDQARAALTRRRAVNRARLVDYAAKGDFPRNRVGAGLVNVFRDAAGSLCAVANLIHLDGHTKLVADTADKSNLIVLADVSSGPLVDWMLTSGFTRAEIALIQEPYLEVPEDEPRDFFAAEDQRLRAHFAALQLTFTATEKASLDAAVAALAERPALARAFLADAAR